MLQTLIDDLAEAPSPDEDAARVEKETGEVLPDIEARDKYRPDVIETTTDEDDEAVRQIVVSIQSVFGPRIERVLAKAGGLLVVVGQWQDDDEQSAENLSAAGLPVAVIDGRTWRSLQRLGSASPLAETRTVFEPAASEQVTENPLLSLAEEKLRSARVLLEQQCYAGVMDLLASALLSKLAGLNDQSQTPAATEAAVWLYSDLVPNGSLTDEQAARVVQVLSLSLATSLPEALVMQAADDVGLLWDSLTK